MCVFGGGSVFVTVCVCKFVCGGGMSVHVCVSGGVFVHVYVSLCMCTHLCVSVYVSVGVCVVL